MFEVRRHPIAAVVAGVVFVLALVLGLMLLFASPSAAQDWRTVSSTRQYAGEERFDVKVEYGAGQLRIEPADDGSLYRSTLRYDADNFRPVTDFASNRLRVGLDGRGRLRDLNIGDENRSRLDLRLGHQAALDLDFEFGAVDAVMELGGLDIRDLHVATGASDSRLTFSRPNPGRIQEMELEMGAASFSARGLANARVDRLRVAGGVGDIVLDFSGEWQGSTDAEIDMGLGSVTLRLPRHIGVRLEKSSFLASVDTHGLVKRGDDYYSPNWDDATQRLDLDIDTAFGSVEIEWFDGNGRNP